MRNLAIDLGLNIDPQIEQVFSKLNAGHRIVRDEALALYNYAPLQQLGLYANQIRQRINPGNQVTFLIDRNINYTNVCNTDCSFCAFYRHNPDHPEAYVNSKDVIAQKLNEALALGATRVLLQGGHNDQLNYDYYLDLISWIHQNFSIEINAFSPSEIAQMSKVSGKTYSEILSDLKQCGMRGLPGGGGEILDDRIRSKVSPKKISGTKWIEIMEIAQDLGLTTTATMVIGFGEDIEHRLTHLQMLRDLQDRSLAKGLVGFNAFISWTLQLNENTSMGRSRHLKNYKVSATEYLKNLALARIFLDNIPHHQSSWPTLGPEIAQIGLHFGCDDFGSTMMEENVVSQAGGHSKNKWAMSPEELQYYISSAGFSPAQRNTSFEIVKDYANVN